MSKKEAIIEFITQEIIAYLMVDRSIEIDVAMNIIYNSLVFEKLQDVETGLYLEGSAYIYDILKDELNGKFQ